METQRLYFSFFNQDLFRMDMLQGLLDILRVDKQDASIIGRKIFLPNAFIGGPRDIHQCYMNPIALIQHF